MLGGIKEDAYTVKIGVASCENMTVFSNLIVCEPPRKRPEVAPEDYIGYNRIPVKVCFTFHLYC